MSSRGRARQRRPAPASRKAGRRQPRPRRAASGPAAQSRLITERYAPPEPRDLPELRGQLAGWLAGEAPQFYLTMAQTGRQWVPPAASIAAGAAQVARQERLRVTGDLYWGSAPMTALTRHAAARLLATNLYPHDLPSRTGFMVCEAPLAIYVNSEGREVEIAAVSWRPRGGPAGQQDHRGIWLTFVSDPSLVFPRQAFTGGTADPAFLAPLMGTVPPVLPDNEAGWPFGELSQDGTAPRRHHRPMGTRRPCRVAADAPAPGPQTAQQADRAARRPPA